MTYNIDEHTISGADLDAISILFLNCIRYRRLAGSDKARKTYGFKRIAEELRVGLGGRGFVRKRLDLGEVDFSCWRQVEVDGLGELQSRLARASYSLGNN